MFQFSLPAEVGQSVSYPTRGGCAEGTATIKRVFANQKLGAHYLLEITNTAGDAVFSNFPCSAEVAMQDAPPHV